MKRAVFFDRDGVMTKNVNGQAAVKVSDLELLNGIAPVVLSLQKREYKIIVVSNQPNIAEGIINEATKRGLVKKFEKLIQESNIFIDDIYYCFHHPKGKVKQYTKICSCHKPKPGMLLKAIRKHKIDPTISYIIGDRASDVKAGSLAGVRTILIDPENSEQNYLLEYKVKPDFIIKKLPDVIKIIKENS